MLPFRPANDLPVIPLRRQYVAAVCLLVGLTCGLLVDGAPSLGQEGDQGEALRREVAALVRRLDADQFEARREAAIRLERLKQRPEAAPILAEEFQRILLSPDTAFEVRRQVERLRTGLPSGKGAGQDAVPLEEIDRLVDRLEDDRYGARLGATRRLEWLLTNPKLVGAIYARLRNRLEKADLAVDTRHWIEPVCARARRAWLTSDPATWDLPEVPDGQIGTWIDDLTRPAPGRDAGVASKIRESASRGLQDLLARDAYVPKVLPAVEARLGAGSLDSDAARRLRELADLARPAMVAEFWHGRRHVNTQHLLIGVPSQAPGADRASHFEYIDDDTAFCRSGQNLSPGDYPVGVAIPHPRYPGAFFHLVNLSTPRHKMAYASLAEEEEAKRLAEITRRTLQRLLAARQRLSVEELAMLEHLDPNEVSRFAGEYFLVVDDQEVPKHAVSASGGRLAAEWTAGHLPYSALGSRHAVVCGVLATVGTRAAMPGLLEAVERKRFLAPAGKAQYQLPWIAALAIARRDPWPSADPWLAQTVGRKQRLAVGEKDLDLGATAAGILLTRHGEEPAQFGLRETEDSLLDNAGLVGYRFETEPDRDAVRRWWLVRQSNHAP